ncbi:biliverdin-producing heme oxygenase [Rubellimicrobium roseum]|uniref:Biliverdin-producing heme oxygenase n=1 Tax=Rubellimicrobium roseum TaxID=687525 RepID=A0A5C4N7U4_9RHOB|nr:biliverdin-producing heme oxygenase [Rubellimicrobium roseum]TNC59367.1 biliverdin-producing heme oxygenase [Rubellimicrobium roseum]
MVTALRADLHHLDRAPALPRQARRFDATSVLYILLGSGLGTRVLHRRWLEATDPAVKGAGSYLGLASPLDAWRALCGELLQRPPQGAEADRVVGDACLLFDLHLGALSALDPAAQGEPYAA